MMDIGNTRRIFRYIMYATLMFLVFICLEYFNWKITPMLNSAEARLFQFTGVSYWTLRLSFDLLNSFLSFAIAVLIIRSIYRINGFIVSTLFAVLAFSIFFWELGGIQCIGNCGLPLWYDISGFIKYPIYAALSGWFSNWLYPSVQPAT